MTSSVNNCLHHREKRSEIFSIDNLFSSTLIIFSLMKNKLLLVMILRKKKKKNSASSRLKFMAASKKKAQQFCHIYMYIYTAGQKFRTFYFSRIISDRNLI